MQRAGRDDGSAYFGTTFSRCQPSSVNGAGPFAPIRWGTIVRLLRYRVHVFCDNATERVWLRDTTSLTRCLRSVFFNASCSRHTSLFNRSRRRDRWRIYIYTLDEMVKRWKRGIKYLLRLGFREVGLVGQGLIG